VVLKPRKGKKWVAVSTKVMMTMIVIMMKEGTYC